MNQSNGFTPRAAAVLGCRWWGADTPRCWRRKKPQTITARRCSRRSGRHRAVDFCRQERSTCCLHCVYRKTPEHAG